MTAEGRFKYHSAPAYTAIPCFYTHSNNQYYNNTVDSNGAATSIFSNYVPYYPAISAYGIYSDGINYTACNIGSIYKDNSGYHNQINNWAPTTDSSFTYKSGRYTILPSYVIKNEYYDVSLDSSSMTSNPDVNQYFYLAI